MQYTLYPNTGRGVQTDRTAVYCDVKGSAKLSFVLPDDGQYVALLTDQYGRQTRVSVENGTAELPVLPPGVYQLHAAKVCGERLENLYQCEPLKIRRMTDLQKNVFEITGAMTDADMRDRLAGIEALLNHYMEICAAYAKTSEERNKELQKAVTAFNETIPIISQNTERIETLEYNYEPMKEE